MADRDAESGLPYWLSVDETVMNNYAKMTESEKRQIIEAVRSVDSAEKVRGIIQDIARME